jgi:hypothetical protein
MRIVTVTGLAALLAGCNMVTSTGPLFSSAETAGQPQMRSGVWMDEDASCAVDRAQPVDKWPGCADSWVVHPGVILAGRDPGTPPSAWTRYPTLLVRGEPPVLQIAVGDDTGVAGYAYVGLRVLKTDAEGRIIEYKAWPALCGPPPAPDPTGEKSAVLTDRPFDGLVLDAQHQDCVASAQGPVRVSARESEGWGGDEDHRGRDHARWVRDGEN